MPERRWTSDRTAWALALVIVALAIGLTIRYNSFATWATDSGAYVSSGYGWAAGELFTPATFTFWAPWAADGQVEFPLGHVQGPIKGTITGQYPLGYPLLIAAALKITNSPLAPHLVTPVLTGLLIWSAFCLGRQMMTAWAGLLAALMIGATPVVLGHAVIPFSDVPAAAFWALAWTMSVRPGHGGAFASGAATAMAVMIRPNLSPLALVIAGTVCFAERSGWRGALSRLVAFGATAVLGPIFVLWSQAELYGHPLQSGYRVPMDFFFKLERVPYNAGLYPRMLAQLHTWLAFGGLLYVPFALRGMRRSDDAHRRGVLVLSAIGLIAVNYALYLPYLTYVGWHWLRFLLPALLAMFLLLATGLDHMRLALQHRWPRVAFLALLPALVVVWAAEEHVDEPIGYERMLLTERYLAEVIPTNAVILTYLHGGAWARATKRPVLRLDMVGGEELDRVVDDLQRRNYQPVFVFDVAVEADLFANRFRRAQLGRLTWPARAEISTSTSIVYYDIADREAFLGGDRWVTDVLVGGRTTKRLINWGGMRADHESVILPIPAETAAFRTALDSVYRDQLARAVSPPTIDPGEFLRWMRRYVRFRLHGCAHAAATERVLQQISDGGASPLCGRPETASFPPENESMDFRNVLEERLKDRPVRQPPTAVDPLGEVVWTQRYLEARVRGCTHQAATAKVAAAITGGARSDCGGREP